MTTTNTNKHYPPIKDDSLTTKQWHLKKSHHVAPECFAAQPPPFCPSQEVYNMLCRILKLLDIWIPKSKYTGSVVALLERLKQLAIRGKLEQLANHPNTI